MSTLRFRVAAAYVLLIVGSIAALGAYILGRVGDDIRESKEDDLAAQARMVANLFQPLIIQGAPSVQLDALAKQLGAETGTRLTVVAVNGTVIAESDADPSTVENHRDRPEVIEAFRSGEGRSQRESETLDTSLSYVALSIPAGGGQQAVVRAARATSDVEAIVDSVRESLIVAAFVIAVCAVIVAVVLSESVLRPLGRVTAAAATIAQGDYATRVRPRPSGEAGELADAFNNMAQKVQEQMNTAAVQRGRLTALLNSSVDAVVAVDREIIVAFANMAAERLFHAGVEQIVGRPLEWLMPNQQLLDAAVLTRDGGKGQINLIERPGQRQLQAVTTPIVGGGQWVVLVVFHDLTGAPGQPQG